MKLLKLPCGTATTARLGRAPFSCSSRRKRVALSVTAQETPSTTEVAVKPSTVTVPVLEWKPDNEGLKELMGFGGSAPERANGRAAMIGFVGILASELSSGATASEQFAESAGSVFLFTVLLSLGTVIPKFLSGTSLADLHAAASGDNLVGGVQDWTQVLRLFDQNYELWSGRLAMIGILGLLAIEAVTGKPFF